MAVSFSEITSRKNEKIIWASKLSDKKTRDKEGVFFTEGIKLLDEAAESGFEIDKLFFTQKALSLYEDSLSKTGCKDCFLVSDEVYEKLSDESSPQGVFAVIKKKKFSPLSKESLKDGGFVILEDIQNPQNLGAIFRCVFSLGSSKIIMTKNCADIYNPKTLRSAMGSVFKAESYVADDIGGLIESLKHVGNRVFCTHLHSQSLVLGTFDFKKSDSIVIGNEGHGVSDDTVKKCTSSVIIPMVENAESLNAATASSIIIWEMNKSKLLP